MYFTPQDEEVSQKFKTKNPDDIIVSLQKHIAPHDGTLNHAGARSRKQRIYFSTPRPLTQNMGGLMRMLCSNILDTVWNNCERQRPSTLAFLLDDIRRLKL